jgi:glycosyltransferase involved in cell wall biosynthesis
MPRVSIIIATFNAEKTLGSCLESIFSQKFDDYEILIADGLSNDNTVSIIQQYDESIDYWHSKADKGIYDAWNTLILQATGDYLCFIGADDYFYDNESLAHVFESLDAVEYDLISSRGLFLSNERKPHLIGKAWNYSALSRRMSICHPGLLHRRKLFDQYGIFDDNLEITADYDFLLRLPKSIRTLHFKEPLVCIGDGGISRAKHKQMLLEKRLVQARCPRIGKTKAALNYYDKLWRIPIAKALGISY